jgi:hypothetical protein
MKNVTTGAIKFKYQFFSPSGKISTLSATSESTLTVRIPSSALGQQRDGENKNQALPSSSS